MKIWNRLSYGLLGGLGAVVLLFASSMANALTSCDAATSKDEPCLAGDLGTLTFVTTGKKQGNQFEYVFLGTESIQSIGTKGGSCEIITEVFPGSNLTGIKAWKVVPLIITYVS